MGKNQEYALQPSVNTTLNTQSPASRRACHGSLNPPRRTNDGWGSGEFSAGPRRDSRHDLDLDKDARLPRMVRSRPSVHGRGDDALVHAAGRFRHNPALRLIRARMVLEGRPLSAEFNV